MVLHEVKNDLTRLWCGPAALSAISGKPASICQAAIAVERGSPTKIVRGVHHWEMCQALKTLGYNTIIENKFPSAPYGFPKEKRLTVAALLRTRKDWAVTDPGKTMYLITAGHHYMVVKGKKFVDSFTRTPTWIRQAPHRRKRVLRVWRVERIDGTRPVRADVRAVRQALKGAA